MAQPTIEIVHIIIVVAFICGLLLVRAYVLKWAPQISNKLVKGRRLVHVETYPLRHQSMVSLMEIDSEKVVIVHGRNQPASLLRIENSAETPSEAKTNASE